LPDLPKNYDPKAVESRLYARWEKAGYFHEEPDPARPPFVVCMPPPNVTGRAHLGHGSTYTTMDVLTRYHRLQGNNADWLPGLDHAAISTESVLIKELAKSGQSRESLGRQRYLERAWEWSREYGGTIDQQFRALGFGPDWERERFTMDEGLSAAVRKVFVQLYREGLIYRGKRLINWDPQAKTTISDAEVEHVERDATLWHIRYPFANLRHDPDTGIASTTYAYNDGIVVASTRPETMLGDVAIAVHPDDDRYKDRIGEFVMLPPLMDRYIPIVADPAVERDFGTGAVKVTPAHDPLDYETGLRHGLEMPSIMDEDGRITGREIDVGPYEGMDRFEARKRIVEHLRESDLLVEEQPYRHSVATSERSGAVVEPMLSLQWFAKMKPLAQPALQAYRDGRLRFVPERYGRTYEQWLENIRDWNVSRQVWWGHQLPVWYTPAGDVVVAESEVEALEIARAQHGGASLARDSDTLDTWFSSGLWPFSILGWPEKTPELECWYPSQVLITGWEIIFPWVVRMVMLGIHFMGDIPFPTVFIAPLVFDAQGRKMSKSLGNAIDPMDLIEKYGADAFRIGMLRQMRLEGQEVRFQESRCEEARNFNNKIWNVTRFALSLPEGLPDARTLPPVADLSLADRWILTRLHDTIVDIGKLFDGFDFGVASETLWKFVWYEFCDWYVEAIKRPNPTRAAVTSFVLNNAMRLLHPIAPFITEEIWLALPHDGRTIMTAAWPDPHEVPVDRDASARFEAIRACVERLRNQRAEFGIAPRTRARAVAPADLAPAAPERPWIEALANVELVAGAPAAGDPLGAIAVEAPVGLLRERYAKEITRLQSEVDRGEKKLSNEAFAGRAAADVVAKEHEKLNGYRTELQRVRAALAALETTA
jgi:valyl-tRNA synthetase